MYKSYKNHLTVTSHVYTTPLQISYQTFLFHDPELGSPRRDIHCHNHMNSI